MLTRKKEEHLAPKALVTPTGETYAMVGATITKDNFILVASEGQARRMDVGDSEGHRMPFVVQEPWKTAALPGTSNSGIGLPGKKSFSLFNKPSRQGLTALAADSIFSQRLNT